MTTNELIAKLRELDPGGEMVCVKEWRDNMENDLYFAANPEIKPAMTYKWRIYHPDEAKGQSGYRKVKVIAL